MIDPKFRASYSILHRWESGDFEGFVKGYFKLEPSPTTREMSEGKDWHKLWENEILKTKHLPELFGGRPLIAPECEVKQVVEIEPWLDFVFIADMIDREDIHEFKTGVSSSSDWVNSNQLACYAVGLTFLGKVIKRGFVHHYDQYNKKYDMSMLWITDKVLKEAHNWIVTLSCEAHEYLRVNNLYERYGKK